VATLHQVYCDVTGQEPVYGGVPGSTDGTILFGRARVPIVTCGPGDTLIPHHVDEYLDIDQLITATRLYAVTAMRYLGVQAA
jgi:succinyl-diaminopimelate desuccinylase